MPITQKSQHGPERSREFAAASLYDQDDRSEDYVVDTEDELRVRRGENGRYVAPEREAIAGRYDAPVRAGQRSARRAIDIAQESSRATLLTARAHPALAAAMLGGIATAAVAGVTLFRANKRENGQRSDWPETAQTRQSVARPASKKKH